MTEPISSPSTDPVRSLLQTAAAGRLEPLPLVDPLTPFDAHLDDAQRDAVARAIAAPDILLIPGPSGTGKTRVAIEIVRQVASAGGRALFLSTDAAALDGVLPSLATAAGVSLVRCLGRDESAAGLPAAVAEWTPAARDAATRADMVRESQAAVTEAERRLRTNETLAPLWTDLRAARTRIAAGAAEREALRQTRAGLADQLRQEAETAAEPLPYFAQRVRGVTAGYAKRIATLNAEATELAAARTQTAEKHAQADAECHALQPKADALKAGRWFSPAYWAAKRDGTLAARLAEAESRRMEAADGLAELAVRDQKRADDHRLADEEFTAERDRHLGDEATRRLVDLDRREDELARAATTDAATWDRLMAAARAAGGTVLPAATDADLTEKAANCESAALAATSDLATARTRAARVEVEGDDLVRQARSAVNVVAGPMGAIADSWVVDAPLFDLLVIDGAHRLVEADFVAAARRARRSVLIGAPADGRTGKPEVFARLGSALRHDVWGKERDRLVARLHSVRGGERRRLESEAVADAPDVELRLYTPADGEPVLAEVAFPDGMPPASAREYLVRELQEITCQPRLRTAVWTESADGVIVRFGPPDPAATFAALDPGVREELAGLETRAVHFATADGWNLERAQGWVAANVGRRDAGRIAPLARPYRACPGLARWLNAAFGLGFAVPPVADTESHVEFLAVPDAGPRRRDGRNDGRPPRVGGAGYETDLSDPRQRAALPADVAAALPASGIVNLPEAQALVRYLEGAHGPTPTVTSPFPAQVALLRALAARSTRLGHARILDTAEAAVTECDLLAVSLTRSHIARAVTFGDAPAVLAGLLSRARRKILFAGDPGTLARRLQWDGPVDHLDAAEAGRERAWVAALADCPRVAPPRLRPSHADGVRA